METKTCKYCKKTKNVNQFIKILSWRRKCCLDCYQLPFLKKQRKRDNRAIQRRIEYQKYYEKYDRKWNVEGMLYRSAKRRAKTYGVPFTLKHADIIVPEYCPVLGIKLKNERGKMCESSTTMYRLYPEKGYTKKNICIMSNRANRIKSDASIEDLEKILAFMRQRLDKYKKSDNIVSHEKQSH